MIEVELPDGSVVEFPEGTTPDQIRKALSSLSPQKPVANPDGTYGQAPEGFTLNPATGQMEDLRSPNNPSVPTGRMAAIGLGAGQGLGYDMLDETVAGMNSMAGGDYDYSLAVMREADRRAQEQYPWSYMVPKVGGAIASSFGLGSAMGLGKEGLSLAARAGQGAGLGAAEGALFGFGQGEGVEDRLKGAATYGTVGGVIGGAAPFAVEGVRRGFDAAVAGPVASMRSAPSEVRASRAVQEALRRSGQSADDVTESLTAAAREGQPEFVMADALGNSGQRMLSGIARTPNDARAEIVDFLANRQGAQGERMARFIGDGLGANDTAAARTTALTKARDTAANTAYSAARDGAGPVNLSGALATIDSLLKRDPILGETALSQGPIGQRLMALRQRMAAGGEQLIDFDSVLNIKSDLFDQIRRGNGSYEISQVYGALDDALEQASDGYRAANDGYRAGSRVIDAVEAGSAAARPTARSADVMATYGKMTPEEQAAFRVGRADPTLARIEAAPVGTNKARPLTSGKAQVELPGMANDGALLQRQIGRENTMFETGNAALGGSRTADNMADAADMKAFDFGPVANLLRGNFAAAAMQAGPTIANTMQGRNTATREMIARALLSKDVQKSLAPAMRADIAAGRQTQVVEALMRSLPRITN